MKEPEKYCVDIPTLCNIKGSLFIYAMDFNNTVIACNTLKSEFFKDLFKCENIIGKNPIDFLKDESLASAVACYKENRTVIQKAQMRQCYHSWFVQGLYRLDLLTLKIPLYTTSGKPRGLLVTSHFLNKISIKEAKNLGFTPRETECLLYLFEGCTAKEIAKATKISPRTVEGYIDNMKTKQTCATTSELLLKTLQHNIKNSASDEFALDRIGSPANLIHGENAHHCVEINS